MVCLARGALLQPARLVALDALCHRLEHFLVLRPVLLLALFRAVGDLRAALDIDGLAEGSAVGAAHVLQVLGHRWVCGDGIGDGGQVGHASDGLAIGSSDYELRVEGLML